MLNIPVDRKHAYIKILVVRKGKRVETWYRKARPGAGKSMVIVCTCLVVWSLLASCSCLRLLNSNKQEGDFWRPCRLLLGGPERGRETDRQRNSFWFVNVYRQALRVFQTDQDSLMPQNHCLASHIIVDARLSSWLLNIMSISHTIGKEESVEHIPAF